MWVTLRPAGTVVVGCDVSWESQNAVVAATREASQRGTGLVLLAVVGRRPYWPESLAWVSRLEAESVHETQSAVDLAMAKVLATDPAVDVRAVIVEEIDSPELADLSREAGLLVLGRRGHSGQVAFSLGSMSGELAEHFHCPMLVVHGHSVPRKVLPLGPDRAVVAGMDVADGSAAVLAVAMAEAVVRDRPLVVVHALHRGTSVDRAMIGDCWRRYREALRTARLPADIPCRLVITLDDPAHALLHRVGPADVLVIGTRGEGRLEGLIAGSVSGEILRRMTCDVMVVRPILAGAPPAPADLVGIAGRS